MWGVEKGDGLRGWIKGMDSGDGLREGRESVAQSVAVGLCEGYWGEGLEWCMGVNRLEKYLPRYIG